MRDQVQVGASPTDWPAYGAVVTKFTPGVSQMPVAVQLPHYAFDQIYRCPGQNGGLLGSAYDPLVVARDPSQPGFEVDELSLRIDAQRLEQRQQLLHLVDARFQTMERDAELINRDNHYGRAFSMLTSSRARRAFDLEQEDARTRDRYGRHKTGQTLLLARRLVEAGVRFVTCFSGSNPGDGWDTHTDNFNRMRNKLMPPEDQGFSALIEDLDARGLLDETLVVWSGEFGRKPHIGQPNPAVNNIGPGGRDHWPQCYSLVFAGAGVHRGMIYSESDRHGEYPRTSPHSPGDLAATIFSALGIDPTTEIHDQQGRPFRLADGQPIQGIFG